MSQQPAKKAVRKSKKSWLLVTPWALKWAAELRLMNAVRKSKKSSELVRPSALKSAGHGGGPITYDTASLVKSISGSVSGAALIANVTTSPGSTSGRSIAKRAT